MCCSHYYNINEIIQESLKIVVSTVFLFCLVSYLVIENLAFLSKIKAHTWENEASLALNLMQITLKNVHAGSINIRVSTIPKILCRQKN